MQAKSKKILPGLLLSIMVAILGKGLGLFLPQLGGATLSILLGILLGNVYFKQPYLEAGTKFSEGRLLEYSVVLLGATVTFQTISQLGLKSIFYVGILMTLTIIAAYQIGRRLGFQPTTSLLMAGGNAVCGSSAIGSIAPAIGAKDQEKGQMITLVNLLGTVMMLTVPFLGLSLFGDNLIEKSALIGGILQSVGQVVAAASMLDSQVVTYAMLFSIMRILCLVFVVLSFQHFIKSKDKKDHVAFEGHMERSQQKLPWYVTGFILVCVINSFLSLPHWLAESAHFVSSWFETIALAAIGLRLDFKKFMAEGPRFLLYGIGVGLCQVCFALLLIYILGI